MARRTGRPSRYFVDRNGQTINGLSFVEAAGRRRFYTTEKIDDKHWRKIWFGFDDEIEAVRKFREWESRRTGTKHSDDFDSPEMKVLLTTMDQARREGRLNQFSDIIAMSEMNDDPRVWQFLRNKILTEPKLVAQKTGIEQIGYLTDLKPPAPSATLDSVLKCYLTDKKGSVTRDELHNAEVWWGEFKRIVGVSRVGDLTADSFKHYRSKTQENQGKRSNAWTRARFGKVNAIINHALTELNLCPSDIAALAHRVKLKKPPKPALSPIDIERDELHAILKHANDFDRAMILVALNCAYNPIDCRQLRWDMIDKNGYVRFDRKKSSRLTKGGQAVVRVACLWNRSVDALAKIKRTDSEYVFPRMSRSVPNRRFQKLVKLAGIERKLVFNNLRDSAQTRAAEAGVAQQQYQCLAGHSFPGCDDAYIRRNPAFVQDACKAIEAYYFG